MIKRLLIGTVIGVILGFVAETLKPEPLVKEIFESIISFGFVGLILGYIYHFSIAAVAQRRARRGVELLDSHYKDDWRTQVNTRKLDMRSMMHCVLGQLEGGYGNGVQKLAIKRPKTSQLGFFRGSGDLVTFRDLDGAWRRLIGRSHQDI